MTETAAFLDSLFVRQRETLRQRLVLMLTPADPDRGRLDPLADALAEHVRVGWLERGALGLDRPRADAWRSLIRAGQIYYGARIPALGETARLGAMTAKHLKALGRLRFVPPALARPLAGLGRLPMPGLRGRRAALAALATYGGDPALLPYLRRETFTALRDQTLARLTREAGPAESLGPDADPLLVVALLRPDDPAFADLTLACQRQWVPLLAIQTDDGDLLARGPLFHVPRFVAVLGSVDDADVRLAGVSEDRVVRPAEALLDGSQTGALFADRIRPPAEKKRLTRANARRGSISHAYGADVIVQRYCGLPEPPAIPAYWHHGWLPPEAFADQPMLIAQKHKVIGARASVRTPSARIAGGREACSIGALLAGYG